MSRNAWRMVGVCALNFCIAVLLLLVSCVWANVYPFGERSFLTQDLFYQYLDFFTWFHGVLHGEGSLFYSTSQALGCNAWGLYSYYLGSPLNLLIGFFDKEALTDGIFLITALKVGLVQVAMVYFLRRRFCLSFFWSSILALGYVWSTWTATQLSNVEWLDALVLLPLAAWSVHELVRNKRLAPLVASIAVLVICCWYTAYMAILYLCLYFVLELFMVCRHINIGCDKSLANNNSPAIDVPKRRMAFRSVLRFVAALSLGLLLSAWTFMPTVLAMTQGASYFADISMAPPSAWANLAASVAAHPKVSIAYIAVFVICVAALVCSICTKRIRRLGRILIIVASVLVFAVATWHASSRLGQMVCAPEDYVSGFFSGGWTEYGVPQLYAGILSLVFAVAFLLTKHLSVDLRIACFAMLVFLLVSVFCLPLYVIWCGFRMPNGFYCRMTFVVIFTMIWMASCFACSQTDRWASLRPRAKVSICAFIAVFVVMDLFIAIHLAWNHIYDESFQEDQQTYISTANEENSELRIADGDTYRVAKDYTRALLAAVNEGMATGYDELSSYSSAHDVNAVDFLNALGYSKLGEISVRYAYPLLSSDSLLGVKYVYSTSLAEGFLRMGSGQNHRGAVLYENPYALSLGYMVDSMAEKISFSDTDNPFERQNILMNSFVGSEVNPYVVCNASIQSLEDGTREYTVDIPEGCLGYAFVKNAGANYCVLSMEGRRDFLENFKLQDSVYGIADARNEARTITIQLIGANLLGERDHTVPLADDAECVFYALDMERFEEVTTTLSANQMAFERFSGNQIDGVINFVQSGSQSEDKDVDGLLMISVPKAKGWSVCVNGEPVETVAIAGGALTGIPVKVGENHISMTFTPPGFVAGCMISGASLVALCLLWLLQVRRGRSQDM